MEIFTDCEHPTHEVVKDGEVMFRTSSKTAGGHYAKGIRRALRDLGQPVRGRIVVRPLKEN